jgi:hypothetical protein
MDHFHEPKLVGVDGHTLGKLRKNTGACDSILLNFAVDAEDCFLAVKGWVFPAMAEYCQFS